MTDGDKVDDRDEKDSEDRASDEPVRTAAAETKSAPKDDDTHEDEDEDETEDDAQDEGDEDEDEDEDVEESKPGRARTAKADKDEPRAPEKRGGGGMTWLLVAAVIVLGGWWLLRGREDAARDAKPPASAQASEQTAPARELAQPQLPAPKIEAPPAAPTVTEAPAGGAPEQAATAEAPKPAASVAGGGFDRIAAFKALAPNVDKATRCRMRGEVSATANVALTFEPSGSIKEATIKSGPYNGSPTGKCVIARLSEGKIPAYSGGNETLIVPVAVR